MNVGIAPRAQLVGHGAKVDIARKMRFGVKLRRHIAAAHCGGLQGEVHGHR